MVLGLGPCSWTKMLLSQKLNPVASGLLYNRVQGVHGVALSSKYRQMYSLPAWCTGASAFECSGWGKVSPEALFRVTSWIVVDAWGDGLVIRNIGVRAKGEALVMTRF